VHKSVNPLLAFGVIVFFGSLLALKFWCDHQSLTLDRLWGIKLSPQNEVVVQLGRRLIFSSLDGSASRIVSLLDLGITEPVGDFAFFNNGDVLLAHNRSGLSAAENLQVYLRQSEPEQKGNDSRLHRCSLESMTCREFSKALPDFPRSFKLFIDPFNEQVYIADTGRHQLWLLDVDGEVLAKHAGFKFPNELAKVGDVLWLADTNHHQIKQLAAQPEGFAEEISHHDAQLSSPYRWPFAFAQLADQWWILIGDNGMANARVVIYDHEWKYSREAGLPEYADPIALLAVDNRMLLTDNRHFCIYQFDAAGKRLPDFVPTAIDAELVALREEAEQWQFYSRMTLGAFIITFIIGFAFALRQHFTDKREADKAKRERKRSPQLAKELAAGIWLTPGVLFRVLPYILMAGCVVFFVFMLTNDADKNRSYQLYWLVSGILLMSVLMFIPMRRLAKMQLGLFADHIEVISYTGKHYSAPHEKVFWTQRAIVVGKLVVPIGKAGKASIFPVKKLDEYVRPFLHPDNKVGELAMMRYQWHSEDGIQKYSWVMVALMTIIYLAMTFDDWWKWLTALT
jgi:hypothetical protein